MYIWCNIYLFIYLLSHENHGTLKWRSNGTSCHTSTIPYTTCTQSGNRYAGPAAGQVARSLPTLLQVFLARGAAPSGGASCHMFRFRYVLHPWTAKYSHWMWHWAIAFCQSGVCDSSATNGTSGSLGALCIYVVSLISGQHPSQWCLRSVV
jgi:hypothetical protein